MDKFDWTIAFKHISLKFHLFIFLISLLAGLIVLVYALKNGVDSMVSMALFVFLLSTVISWLGIRVTSQNGTVKVKTVLCSADFGKELLLLFVVGLMIVVNIEMSNAFVRLGVDKYAYVALFPYLSFAAFVFKAWRVRFAFLAAIFVVGLALGALQI